VFDKAIEGPAQRHQADNLGGMRISNSAGQDAMLDLPPLAAGEGHGRMRCQCSPYRAVCGDRRGAVNKYFEGVCEFAEDEALVMTAPLPDKVRYWSAHLADEIFLSDDFIHRQTSLNLANREVDDDGLMRVVISENDPCVRNWLDASGHRRGIVIWRWLQCSHYPMPTVERFSLDRLRAHLAIETLAYLPSQRADDLHRRRIGPNGVDAGEMTGVLD